MPHLEIRPIPAKIGNRTFHSKFWKLLTNQKVPDLGRKREVLLLRHYITTDQWTKSEITSPNPSNFNLERQVKTNMQSQLAPFLSPTTQSPSVKLNQEHRTEAPTTTTQQIPLKDRIKDYFHLPIYEASLKLGCSCEQLRATCRESNLERWPYSYQKCKGNGTLTPVKNISSPLFVHFEIAPLKVEKSKGKTNVIPKTPISRIQKQTTKQNHLLLQRVQIKNLID